MSRSLLILIVTQTHKHFFNGKTLRQLSSLRPLAPIIQNFTPQNSIRKQSLNAQAVRMM